jgi:hypothetical protein
VGRRWVRERAEHAARKGEHFARRAIRDPQRFHLHVREAEVVKRRTPVAKARVHVQSLCCVARERHAPVFGHDAEQHREVDRCEVLRLVHEEVLIHNRSLPFAKLAAKELVSAE